MGKLVVCNCQPTHSLFANWKKLAKNMYRKLPVVHIVCFLRKNAYWLNPFYKGTGSVTTNKLLSNLGWRYTMQWDQIACAFLACGLAGFRSIGTHLTMFGDIISTNYHHHIILCSRLLLLLIICFSCITESFVENLSVNYI